VYLYASDDLGHGDCFGIRPVDVRDALGRGGGIVRCGWLRWAALRLGSCGGCSAAGDVDWRRWLGKRATSQVGSAGGARGCGTKIACERGGVVATGGVASVGCERTTGRLCNRQERGW
jgi:hypothetical protein